MSVAAPLEPSADGFPSVVYATWGRRCAAIGIDYFVVSIPIVLIVMAADSAPRDVQGWVLVVGGPVILLFFAAYFIGFHGGARGQTLGKRMLAIAVRDATTFERIGYAKALGRLLVTVVLWSLFYVGGIFDTLWPLWDIRKQSLHDKMVGTVVLRV